MAQFVVRDLGEPRRAPGAAGLLKLAEHRAMEVDRFAEARGAGRLEGLVGQVGNAEWRHLTVLFCDMVDSTALSAAMDPEEFHDLMMAFQRDCAQGVEAAGGFVARFAGDGVLAYFGYPAALEDAPQRAIHAALNLRDAETRLAPPNGAPVSVRIGIATGLVVVGDQLGAGRAQESAVAGQTPNLAARLQALATPDSILVSEATKRLAEGVFEFRPLGDVQIRGLPAGVPVWEVVGRRATISRYEGRRAVGVSPLISRKTELAVVLSAWREAREGRCRSLGLVGDPGIGKSRLVEEVRRVVMADPDVAWLEGGGVSIYDHTPYHVVGQFAPRLGVNVAGAGPEPRPGGASAEPTHDVLPRQVLERIWSTAAKTPTAVVIEDLHWVDPSTLELLEQLVTSGERALLLIYTARFDVPARWPSDRHQVLRLGRLDMAASASLARSVAGGSLSLGQIEVIVSQAAGVPLYIEELTRRVAQRADAGTGALPSTLSDLLAKTLEDLGAAKSLAQVAAVLGQTFPRALFAAMVEPDQIDADVALCLLQEGAVIARREVEGSPVYGFRHALIATAAYDTLLRRRRRMLHERAARIIVERFPELAESEPQVLARHWTEAGDALKAVTAWEHAARLATARRAFREAEHAYRQALSILDAADLPDRDGWELRVRAAFNRVLHITQGYSAVESARSSDRVRELAERIGADEALAREELLRWRSLLTAGDYAQAEAIAGRFAAQAETQPEVRWTRAFSLRAGIQLGFYLGDLARSERDYRGWSQVQDSARPHNAPGDDILSIRIAGLVAQADGRQGVAQERITAALDSAASRGPYDMAMALHTQSCFHHFARDSSGLARSAEALSALARERGFEFADHLATGWLGIADAEAGRAASALRRSMATIAGFDRLKARVSLVFWCGALARARWLTGDGPGALEDFSRALRLNHQERIFRPEVLMARAAVLAAMGRGSAAERDLRAAARLSQAMGARLFQVRALIELGRRQLSNGDWDGLRRSLRAAESIAADRPDLCARELSNLATLSQEAGFSSEEGLAPCRLLITA